MNGIPYQTTAMLTLFQGLYTSAKGPEWRRRGFREYLIEVPRMGGASETVADPGATYRWAK